MVYITFGEGPSGVYNGQVIDVCRFLNKRFEVEVKLIAFISIRKFLLNRKRIKNRLPGAVAVPMTPKINTWKWNVITLFILCLIRRERVAICRNPKAANLALKIKKIGLLKTVCYDGRGATAAEYKEYQATKDSYQVVKDIEEQERKAVLLSDYRIAVSQKLIDYWKRLYDYNGSEHVIIPCTVSDDFLLSRTSDIDRDVVRKEMGFLQNDVVLVYAGSMAGWQSFKLLSEVLSKLLGSKAKFKVLFLSKENKSNNKLKQKYPDQVIIKWVAPDKVSLYLKACDYGLLIREPSLTNQVSAPTKFAEYLISGLPVIISGKTGDYTRFVKKNRCGIVFDNYDSLISKLKNDIACRGIKKLAIDHFTKDSEEITSLYQQLVLKINKN